MATTDNQNLCTPPESSVVFQKTDLDNLSTCDTQDESLLGPSDAELQKDLEDFRSKISELAPEDTTQQILDCINSVNSAVSELQKQNDLNIKRKITLSKLIEIRDNMYPVYSYHKTRYDLLDISKYKTSELSDFTKGLPFGSFAKVYAKLKDAIYSIPGVGNLIGGNTIIKDMKDYSGIADIKDNLPETDILTLSLNRNLFNITLNISDIKPLSGDTTTWKTYIYNTNILKGNPTSGFNIKINPPDTKENTGVLYESYYNKLKDVNNNFFTVQERGLSTVPSEIDPKLIETSNNVRSVTSDTSSINDASYTTKEGGIVYYVKDSLSYQKFYKDASVTFPRRIETIKPPKIESRNEKAYSLLPTSVKLLSSRINTSLKKTTNSFNQLAKAEVAYYLNSYSTLSDKIKLIRITSNSFLSWWNSLNKEIESLNTKINQGPPITQEDMIKYLSTKSKCIPNETPPTDYPPQVLDTEKSYTSADPNNPRPDKMCYWVKFAKDATLVGLLPFIDINYQSVGTSFRYWPIGIFIPTPIGIINIPMPMVWVPLVTFSGRWGTIVIFLNICGTIPLPYVFMISPKGYKYFSVTMWGASKRFGMPTGEKIFKTFDPRLGFITKPVSQIPEIPKIPKDDFDFMFNKTKKMILDRIDNVAVTSDDMSELNTEKVKVRSDIYKDGRSYNDINKDLDKKPSDDEISKRLKILSGVITKYIDKIDLPSYTYPTDPDKKQYGGPLVGMQTVFDESLSMKFKSPLKFNDVKDKIMDQIGTVFDSISGNEIPLDTTLNLKSAEDFTRFKKYMSDMANKIMDNISNDKLFYTTSIVPNITISFPIPCKDPIDVIPPDLTKILLVRNTTLLLLKTIDTLTNVEVINFLGINTINTSNMASLFQGIIDKWLPKIPYPADKFCEKFSENMKANMVNIAKVFDIKFTVPEVLSGVFKSLSIPFPFPSSIVINLNNTKVILKKITEDFFSKADNLSDILNLDLLSNGSFLNLHMPDIKVLLQTMLEQNFDNIKPFIKPFYDIFSLIKGLRNFEINQIDLVTLANPVNLPTFAKDIAISIASSEIDMNDFIQIPDIEALNKGMEILKKIKIPFIASAAIAAYSVTPEVLNRTRTLIQPFMLWDDLPPWERMDINSNALYVFFLDEFCHTGKKFHYQSAAFGPYPGIIPGLPQEGTG